MSLFGNKSSADRAAGRATGDTGRVHSAEPVRGAFGRTKGYKVVDTHKIANPVQRRLGRNM